jgi:hypothetical protein
MSHAEIMTVGITPASYADITALKEMEIDLPEQSILYGDRAYNSQVLENELLEIAKIQLIPQRKQRSNILDIYNLSKNLVVKLLRQCLVR